MIPNKKLSYDRFYDLSNSIDRKIFEMRYGKESYLTVPCGNCPACIEKKANDWACRIYYEWLHSSSSSFFTLTYNDESLLYNDVTLNFGFEDLTYSLPQLSKPHVQKFIHDLRKLTGNGLRYFLGAEYGETLGRPHYHVIFFNYPNDIDIYEAVNQVWNYGNIQCSQEVNIQRVMYVAKYIYSSSLLPYGNVISGFQKPFILMSRRPGLGYQYFQNEKIVKYHNDNLDTTICLDVENKRLGLPRYYRSKIFSDENKEILYRNWIDNPVKEPTQEEIRIFLKRFNKKKRGKSI